MFNSARLKKLRKDLGLSQVQMSEKLSMEQSTYCKYETNKSDLNLTLLQKLKDEFGIDPNEFLNSTVAPELANSAIQINQFSEFFSCLLSLWL